MFCTYDIIAIDYFVCVLNAWYYFVSNFQFSYEAAKVAAGCVLELTEQVVSGQVRNILQYFSHTSILVLLLSVLLHAVCS